MCCIKCIFWENNNLEKKEYKSPYGVCRLLSGGRSYDEPKTNILYWEIVPPIIGNSSLELKTRKDFKCEGFEGINEEKPKQTNEKDFKQITIEFINKKPIRFKGKYLPKRQKPNWHYYQKDDGTIFHCRKEHMVYVSEK